jgi:hypothetical protein
VILSLYVVADLDSKHGLEFVKEALSSIVRIIFFRPALRPDGDLQNADSRTRISFIHNPAGELIGPQKKIEDVPLPHS